MFIFTELYSETVVSLLIGKSFFFTVHRSGICNASVKPSRHAYELLGFFAGVNTVFIS